MLNGESRMWKHTSKPKYTFELEAPVRHFY